MTRKHTSPLGKHFAAFLMRLAAVPSAELALAARLVSEQTAEGHVCVDLAEISRERSVDDGEAEQVFPESAFWGDILLKSGVVGSPGERKPLIFDSPLLYLHRYFHYEQVVADFISSRSGQGESFYNVKQLDSGLDRLFGVAGRNAETDWQKEAARMALSGRFCVITGGPGTGKTTTVARMLALYLEQNQDARVLLAAPTGKAAARLQEAIRHARSGLECLPEIKEKIPATAQTIHRLLGWSRMGWRYHGGNPLPADLLVIDEASMVDLPLMAALMSALPNQCDLVLLGDRDQLSSVQPGAVLGDVCQGLAMQEQSLCLAELKKSYRFDAASGIGALSQAVNKGDGERALAILQDSSFADVIWHQLGDNGEDLAAKISEKIVASHDVLCRSATPQEALGRMGEFAVLTALRRGPFGAEGVNGVAEREINARGEKSFHGRPVMVTSNQYAMQLYNGDTGLILKDLDSGGDLRAYFAEGGGVRKILCARLPEHETAFAMTIHKSQGSEFDHVVIVLPPEMSPVLCRELIYTGITRAVKSVEVWGRKDVFVKTVATCSSRRSGLVRRMSCEVKVKRACQKIGRNAKI